ncbi:MAG: hypothetical protein GXP30_04570 [Verrucomicrobia bacterium]|nr:hypothetical protein [Verrucomicrobiota bacterium]
MKTFLFLPLLSALLMLSAQAQHVLKPMPAKQWFSNYQVYLKQAATVNNSADSHYQLGQWAWSNGLEDEAWEQWILALRIDPDHVATRKSTGFSRENSGDRWARAGEINPDWIRALEIDNRALSLNITIEDDADADFLSEYQWRLRRLNWFIWQITEGQIYIKDIHIQDKTQGSPDSSIHRIVIPKGQLNIPVMKGGGALCKNSGRPNWQVISGGRCYVRILAHEICHGLFGVPDERHGCYCLMQGGLYGIKTQDLVLCDDHSHRPAPSTPDSCWAIILKRYPGIKHPNTEKFGRVPETKFTVLDN